MTTEPNRPRRDPRAERAARVAGQVTAAVSEPAQFSAAVITRVIDDPGYLILTVVDAPDRRLSAHDRDVLGAARKLADAGGGAVLALAWSETLDLGAAGADRAMIATADGAEARAALVLAAIERHTPRHVLFADRAPGGGDIGRRVAARLGERAATNVVEVAQTGIVRRAGAHEVRLAPPHIMLLAPEAADPVTGARHEARPVDPPDVTLTPRVQDEGPVAIDASTVPLAEADLIVAAGTGVTDWPAFHRLAMALGATEGGSRAVVDAGHLPSDRQVGASGTLVEPRCYLALGIAGAPQHLQGIAHCERVVAVNTDLHADMIKRADLAIIADAQAVMPALARLAEARRRG
ncbi:MAG: electron transfer flavoprotein subunit alpha/FixB family protein [Alphaproteobacteria bacterium]